MLTAVPGAAERNFSALRSIAYGASPITTTVLKAALRTFRCPLFGIYGLTETTGAITQLDPADHEPEGPREYLLRSAGRPYPWVELQIVDPGSGARRGPREVGEVWLRAPNVAAGYFNRPRETASALSADGWLRTGDGGYVDEDGYLFLTDRIKDMIVSGGENVYPIEVEEVLSQHPAVVEAAVIGVPDARWGEVVAALVVRQPGVPEVDADELVAFARGRLAGYKLPRRVEFVEELPRTPTGKVLKRELRVRYGGAVGGGAAGGGAVGGGVSGGGAEGGGAEGGGAATGGVAGGGAEGGGAAADGADAGGVSGGGVNAGGVSGGGGREPGGERRAGAEAFAEIDRTPRAPTAPHRAD
jgi:long-chain acyl-CoA synthetase